MARPPAFATKPVPTANVPTAKNATNSTTANQPVSAKTIVNAPLVQNAFNIAAMAAAATPISTAN
jgi:hypothetical protein